MSRWDRIAPRIEDAAERGWQVEGLRLALIGATAFALAAGAGMAFGWAGVGYAAAGGAVVGLVVRVAAKRKAGDR